MAKLWDVDGDGEPLVTLKGHTAPLTCVRMKVRRSSEYEWTNPKSGAFAEGMRGHGLLRRDGRRMVAQRRIGDAAEAHGKPS